MINALDIEGDGLIQGQKNNVEDFLQHNSDVKAIIIEGSKSTISDFSRNYLESLKVEFVNFKQLESGKHSWDVIFEPATRNINITDENGKFLVVGNLFEQKLKGLELAPLEALKNATKKLIDFVKDNSITEKPHAVRRMERSLDNLNTVINSTEFLPAYRNIRETIVESGFHNMLYGDSAPSSEYEHDLLAGEVKSMKRDHERKTGSLNNRSYFRLDFIKPFKVLESEIKNSESDLHIQAKEKVRDLEELAKLAFTSRKNLTSSAIAQ